jgi:hypothetical protein
MSLPDGTQAEKFAAVRRWGIALEIANLGDIQIDVYKCTQIQLLLYRHIKCTIFIRFIGIRNIVIKPKFIKSTKGVFYPARYWTSAR